MTDLTASFERLGSLAVAALNSHGILAAPGDFSFSASSRARAADGQWDECATELRDSLSRVLGGALADHHRFIPDPRVRWVAIPDGRRLGMALVNEQSREWYGAEHFLGTCDFLIEAERGLFQGCKRFLDLGGHQMIWATYYASTAPDAHVTSFEPSVLNVVIGQFNCLVNGVLDQVEIVPFAVAADMEGRSREDVETSKMLVDFMRIPLRARRLMEVAPGPFDFVKTDIEGYEYEMLSDRAYVSISRGAYHSHFELHLGHLVRRGISVADCVRALKTAGFEGVELYSQRDMYDFLSFCDPASYPAFVLGGEDRR